MQNHAFLIRSKLSWVQYSGADDCNKESNQAPINGPVISAKDAHCTIDCIAWIRVFWLHNYIRFYGHTLTQFLYSTKHTVCGLGNVKTQIHL